jgi:hypothetical protein
VFAPTVLGRLHFTRTSLRSPPHNKSVIAHEFGRPYLKLNLINYVVASDGGSIALSFSADGNSEYWVSLDKGIDSPTKNRIFTSEYNEVPLTSDQEKQLLQYLEVADNSIDGGAEILQEVGGIIRCR